MNNFICIDGEVINKKDIFRVKFLTKFSFGVLENSIELYLKGYDLGNPRNFYFKKTISHREELCLGHNRAVCKKEDWDGTCRECEYMPFGIILDRKTKYLKEYVLLRDMLGTDDFNEAIISLPGKEDVK